MKEWCIDKSVALSLQGRLRQFLGIDVLEAEQDASAKDTVDALTSAHAMLESLNTLLQEQEKKIVEMEKEIYGLRMIQRDRAGRSVPVLDWEQVQAQKLAEMFANPNKEEMQ